MDKQLGRLAVIGMYLLVVLLLVAAVGGAITNRPLLLTVIKSHSMNPTLERGDIVFIRQVDGARDVQTGDIIVFNTETGSLASQGWIMHRVVGGDPEKGFITQGDGNKKTDQDDENSPPIKPEWIANRALTLGPMPLKIPLLGYLPLWIEGLQTHPLLLPGLAVVLTIILGASMAGEGKKKKKANRRLEQQLLYFFSGLTLVAMLAATMLTTSKHLSLVYEVSPDGQGVVMGSSVGILQIGETVHKPVTELKNSNFFPVIASITSQDPQISFSQQSLLIKPGDGLKVDMQITALETGSYQSSIWVGIFFPFLPAPFIHFLAQKSYWLALGATSLIPGLPLLLFPVLEPRLRQLTITEIQRAFRRIGRTIPFLR